MSGVFGCASKGNCARDIFYGTDYLSHLGTEMGGMAVFNKGEINSVIRSLANFSFRERLEPALSDLEGNLGIGMISNSEIQPIFMRSPLGKFQLVTVSRINNIKELIGKVFSREKIFSGINEDSMNSTEFIAKLICKKDSILEGIVYAQECIKGSCTMLLISENGEIFAARDRLGRTPLILGKKKDGFAVSSESCAFPNLGYEVERELGPGEIVRMTPDGFELLKKPGKKMQICSFLWVYHGFPASNYEGQNVEEFRYRCGKTLAQNDSATVDYVAGVPDSGIGYSMGYANATGLPQKRPFVKYTPSWTRSSISQKQGIRDFNERMRLIPISSLIAGQRILFCEDSIVGGSQLKKITKLLFEYGVKEVHMRSACPTLIHPCPFLNFSQSRSTFDLIGRKAINEIAGGGVQGFEAFVQAGSSENLAMVESIRARLGLSTLKFQALDDLVQAIGLPKKDLCTHCWDGSSYF